MILHSIRVENWRCFLTPVTVGPLDEGLNVIYAPNGSGKSKLFEALHRTLLDSHRATGQGILAVQPWGRLLPPRVCLEFTEGRATYRLTKQFLHAPSALLERRENGHYVRLAQGDPVEDLVREMLSSDATGRRLTKQQHWGIAQVLWAPQGELRFGELSDSLITNIRASLSAQMTGARGLAIQRRMEALYGQYFTPTGKARSGRGSRLVQLQERLAAAEETLDLGRALHEQFEDTVEKIADLTERSQAAHHHVVELEQQVDLLKAKAEDHHGLVAEKERWSERVTAISSKLDALQQRIKRASASTARVRRAQQTLGELSGSRLEVASESETLTAAEAEAQAALESARAEQDALAGLRERAQAAVDLCNARLDQENLETLISRIQEARRVAEECSSCAADLAAPGAEDLAKIRRAVRQRDEAQVRLEASLLHLELTPEKHGHLEIISGDRSGEHLMLEPGHAVRVDGSPGVEVAVDGLGHIRAWGPDGSSDEHRSALAEAVSGLAGLTEPYGTDDETELERLNERSRTLEAKASNARSRLEALLDGKRIEDLLEEAKSKAATLHSILESYPEWVESPPDADVLGDELRREEERVAVSTRDAASVYDRARREADGAKSRLQQIDSRIDQLHETLRSDEEELAQVTSDQAPLDELGARVAQLQEELSAAQKQKTEIEQVLGERGGGLLLQLEQLTARHCQAEAAAQQARDDVVREEAQLGQLESMAPYSRLAKAEEAVDQLRMEVAQEEMRADAVRLLYDTVDECRERAFNAVVGRVESSAEEILGHIAGNYLGTVRFSDSFTPEGVVPPVLEDAVSLDNLSGGETEQLYLATRLALASFLADEKRQMVVLDDVLTATDRVRLGRVLQALDDASERLQVIILTCHADRYERLAKARFFELEALKEV